MPLVPITLLSWRLAIDPAATAQACAGLWGACSCAYWRNFLAAQAQLPAKLHQILQTLGVDPARPVEIIEYTQNPDGSHMYSWWYHAVGQILASHRDYHQLTPEIEVRISARTDLADPAFPRPLLQIEVFSDLPWLLDEHP